MHITNFTAVSVNAIAHTVDKTVVLSFDSNLWKITDIFSNGKRIAFLRVSEIVSKVIACAVGEIQYFIIKINAFDIVDKSIERSVTAGKDNIVIFFKACYEYAIVRNLCHIDIFHLIVYDDFERFCAFQCISVTRLVIIKYICRSHNFTSLFYPK